MQTVRRVRRTDYCLRRSPTTVVIARTSSLTDQERRSCEHSSTFATLPRDPTRTKQRVDETWTFFREMVPQRNERLFIARRKTGSIRCQPADDICPNSANDWAVRVRLADCIELVRERLLPKDPLQALLSSCPLTTLVDIGLCLFQRLHHFRHTLACALHRT